MTHERPTLPDFRDDPPPGIGVPVFTAEYIITPSDVDGLDSWGRPLDETAITLAECLHETAHGDTHIVDVSVWGRGSAGPGVVVRFTWHR